MKNESYDDRTNHPDRGRMSRSFVWRKVQASRSRSYREPFGASGRIGTGGDQGNAQAKDLYVRDTKTTGLRDGKAICTYGVLTASSFVFLNVRQIWRRKSFDFKVIMILFVVSFSVLTDMAVQYAPR